MNIIKKIQIQDDKEVIFYPETNIEMIIGLKDLLDKNNKELKDFIKDLEDKFNKDFEDLESYFNDFLIDLESELNKQKLELSELKGKYPYDTYFDKINEMFNLKVINSSVDRDDKLSIKENTFYNIKGID